MSQEKSSFFKSLTGIFTGLASLIAAASGLYIAVNNDKPIEATKTIIIDPRPEKPSAGLSAQNRIDIEAQHKRELSRLEKEKELGEIKLRRERERIKGEQEIERLKLEVARQKANSEKELERLKREAEQARIDALSRQATAKLAEDARHAPEVSGNWNFTNATGTYRIILQQSRNSITLQEFDSMGNMIGEGKGRIQGHSVNLVITEMLFFVPVTIIASLEVSRDGQRLAGDFVSQLGSYNATWFRQ